MTIMVLLLLDIGTEQDTFCQYWLVLAEENKALISTQCMLHMHTSLLQPTMYVQIMLRKKCFVYLT